MDTDLTKLALLTDTEQRLVSHAAVGVPLDLRVGDPDRDQPERAEEWDERRVIRARVLEALLLGERDDWPLHHRGLSLVGARIDGHLNLQFGTVSAPVLLLRCALNEPVTMTAATLQALAMPGTRLAGLSADGVDVTGKVFLRDGFTARGEVRLAGAKIGGSLDCNGASFTNEGGHALIADCVDVTGNVFLGHGFTATGTVRLPGAKIGGSLSCLGGSFTSDGGHALIADRVDVTGSVVLVDGFTARGEVRLAGAKIGGSLDCDGGSFTNEGGHALSADGVEVTGGVFLRDGFTARGAVRLPGAKIGLDLDCDGGSFINEGGNALHADGVDVTGNVYQRDDFTASGEVRLPGAKIGLNLECAFTNTGSNGSPGLIDVRGAAVGVLVDEVTGWPRGWRGEGFTYRDFGGVASVDVTQRLGWLGQEDGGFRPGPYSQLAAVYRRRGDPEAARKVLIARERRRTSELTWWRQLLRRVWGAVSAYGYQPWRAIAALLVLITASAVAFGTAPMTELGSDDRVVFYPWLYAADLAIPLVDLRQAGDYQPRDLGAQWCMWATIALGWFLSGAFLAAVTGLFKPDE